MPIDRRNFVFVLRRGPLTLADGRVLLEGEELWQPALLLNELKGKFHVSYCWPSECIDEERDVTGDRIRSFKPNDSFWNENPQLIQEPTVQKALSLLQSRNEDEHYAAERKEFLHSLYSFMDSIGQPIVKAPFLGYQELDLYHLYQIVTRKGGMDEVTRNQEWKSVYLELGIPTMSTSASYNTRTNYKKYLYLYELKFFSPTVEKLMDDERVANFAYPVNAYVKIISSTYQTYYAQIVKRRHQTLNLYYIHYNGWSTSHDEWMPEGILLPLDDQESIDPKKLTNPVPSRSSKSNYLITNPYYLRYESIATGLGIAPGPGRAADENPNAVNSGWSSGGAGTGYSRTYSTTSKESSSASDGEAERDHGGTKKSSKSQTTKNFKPHLNSRIEESDETGYASDTSVEQPSQLKPKQQQQQPMKQTPVSTNLQGTMPPKRTTETQEENTGFATKRMNARIRRNNLHRQALLLDTPYETYSYLEKIYPDEVEKQQIDETITSMQTIKQEIEVLQKEVLKKYSICNGKKVGNGKRRSDESQPIVLGSSTAEQNSQK